MVLLLPPVGMTLDSVERSSQGYAGCREECKSPMLDVTRRAFENETLLRTYHGRGEARSRASYELIPRSLDGG
jgi:hypothetical protein